MDPIRDADGRWLDRDAYIRRTFSHPRAGVLTKADQKNLRDYMNRQYEVLAISSIQTGEVDDIETAVRLVGKTLAEPAWLDHLIRKSCDWTFAELLERARPFVLGQTESELRNDHKRRIRAALSAGWRIPAAVEADYPRLVAAERPWQLPLAQWAALHAALPPEGGV